MKLVVLSPEGHDPREHAALAAFFAAGLERYHVRKPRWTERAVRNFVRRVPEKWHARLVLHRRREWAEDWDCGGAHFQESEAEPAPRAGWDRHGVPISPVSLTSRSCHTLAILSAALGRFHSVFFSPVFPSISKPGYTPSPALSEVTEFLSRRTEAQRKTSVIALGGVTPLNAVRCAEMGFDGVAVLGALWQAAEPLQVFEALQQVLSVHAAYPRPDSAIRVAREN